MLQLSTCKKKPHTQSRPNSKNKNKSKHIDQPSNKHASLMSFLYNTLNQKPKKPTTTKYQEPTEYNPSDMDENTSNKIPFIFKISDKKRAANLLKSKSTQSIAVPKIKMLSDFSTSAVISCTSTPKFKKIIPINVQLAQHTGLTTKYGNNKKKNNLEIYFKCRSAQPSPKPDSTRNSNIEDIHDRPTIKVS